MVELEAIKSKWGRARARNSTRALADLQALEAHGVDVSEAVDALEEYCAMARGDYEDAEEYAEDRSSAWDTFLEALDTIEVPEA